MDIQTLSKRGMFRIVFLLSPVFSSIRILLAIINGAVSSGLLALTIANFVDAVIVSVELGDQVFELYVAIFFLLIVLGVYKTVATVEKVVDVKLRLDVNRKIKPFLIRKQASLEYKNIENDTSWEKITRIMRDPAGNLVNGFGTYIVIVQILASIVSVISLLIVHVWWAAIVIVAFSIPLFYISLRSGKKNYVASQEAERFHRKAAYLDGLLTGRDNIEERTVFGYGERLSAAWKEQYEISRKMQLKVALRQFVAMKASSLILAITSLLIAVILVVPVVNGQMTIGLFMGIVSSIFSVVNRLAGQMTDAIERLSGTLEYMKEFDAFVGMKNVKNVLSKPCLDSVHFETLEFKNVSFHYPSDSRMVLRGLNFTLNRGKHYAFVGKNGAGKSTFVKLLTGLYDDYEGEILINGIELRQYSLDQIKGIFSMVHQDFAKYFISVRDNIAIGNVAKIKNENLVIPVETLGVKDLVLGLKYGLDTPMGKIDPHGQDLSEGQWQRLAFARSLFSDAPIRILDEPTSALDPIRESKMYQEFENMMANKTSIFISHRLGSTKLADVIFVIDDGKVIEQGNHDELVAAEGMYAQMYESQRSWYQ